MESKKIVKIVVGVIVVVVLVILFASGAFQKGAPEVASPNGETPTNTEGNASGTSDMSLEPSAPVEVTGGPEGSEANPVTAYEIKIVAGKFIPEKTTITKGEKAQVSIVAVDADYDVLFSAPVEKYLSMKKGQAAVFGFDTEKAGTYTFGCRDLCPAGEKMTGQIVVK